MKADQELVTSFGYWVRRRRKALDLTQAGLAQAVGCALVTLKKIEWDERRPSAPMAERLANCLDIPPAEKDQFLRLARGEFITATPSLSAGLEPRSFKHNLPPLTTPFIGREKELADIIRRLKEPTCRLLTLVGPGGIGKTWLALQAVHRLVDLAVMALDFEDGIFFVPLVSVNTFNGIVSAMAKATNFNFYNHVSPQQQLLHYLEEKRLLLVLDNFEHLLSAAPAGKRQEEDAPGGAVAFITEILAVAAGVKILVTSREGLNVREAWFHPLAGLSFPPLPQPARRESGIAPAPEPNELSLDGYDAIKLFTQSARRSQVGFSLAAEAEHVVRICQLVEGMPLGLELAAAWLKSLPVEKIAQEIEHSLDILAAPYQNVPERHRSMRAVFEQSWQLLPEAERAVLNQLSVFQGSFYQAAAAQVTGATLLTLAPLVEKSLLQVTGNGRYRMHELLRQFAAEKLKVASEAEARVRERHSHYYLEFLTAREQQLTGKAQLQALEEIGAEISNVRLAWLWAVAQNDGAAIGQSLVSLYHFFQIRSLYHEGQELFGQAMTQLQPASAPEARSQFETLQARLSARRGALFYFLGDYETAKQHLQTSLKILTSQGEQAFALLILGQVADIQGKGSLAEQLLGQSLAMSREIGSLSHTLEALHALAHLVSNYGDFPAAKRLATESLALSRRSGSPDQVAHALHALAWSTHCLGAYSEAERYWQEGLAISQAIGNHFGIAYALASLGWVAFFQEDPKLSEAIAYCQKALMEFRHIGHRWNVAMCLGDLALIANESAEFEQAVRYSREGLAIAEEIGTSDLMAYNLYCLGTAICGLGDFQIGRPHIIKALGLAWEAQIMLQAAGALFYLAVSLARESNRAEGPAPLKLQQKAKALELLAFVIEQPACWQPIKDRAAPLQARLEAELPPKIVATAKARAKSQTLDEVVAEILHAAQS
jgi:predicted ATPase/transcriptional regulator with XRE-family HTH domain